MGERIGLKRKKSPYLWDKIGFKVVFREGESEKPQIVNFLLSVDFIPGVW